MPRGTHTFVEVILILLALFASTCCRVELFADSSKKPSTAFLLSGGLALLSTFRRLVISQADDLLQGIHEGFEIEG